MSPDTLPKSIKEYWNDPHKNRRHSSGRREDDYAVCSMHDEIVKDTKERVCRRDAAMQVIREEAERDLAKHEAEAKMKFDDVWKSVIDLRNEVVGKFTFRIIVSVFGVIITLIAVSNSFLLNKLLTDVDLLKAAVTTLVVEHKVQGK